MSNPNFNPEYSSNSIFYDTNMEECLTDHIDDMQAEIDTLKTGKANINHVHEGYALAGHVHNEYASVDHTHTGYASTTHTHSYNDLEDKPVIPTTLPANGGNADTVDGKHASDFAASSHTHSKSQISGLTEPSDYVVVNGVNGIWAYRKWNSGVAECWGNHTDSNINISTAWGNIFDSNKIYGTIYYPTDLFINTPVCMFSVQTTNEYNILSLEVGRGGTKLYTPCWWYTRATAQSGCEATVAIHAIGRWK